MSSCLLININDLGAMALPVYRSCFYFIKKSFINYCEEMPGEIRVIMFSHEYY